MILSNVEIGNRIKGILSIKNISRNDLASKMSISYNSLTKKLNGKIDFTLKDMHKIKNILNLDVQDCGNIFFNNEFLIKKQTE